MMGAFIDDTGGKHAHTHSEWLCGAALARLLQDPNWVVVLRLPRGPRSAGHTADCDLYQGGSEKVRNIQGTQGPKREPMDAQLKQQLMWIERNHNHWGTVDVYTPKANDSNTPGAMVRDKLRSQAKAVIVDLWPKYNTEGLRDREVSGIIYTINDLTPPRTVIFKWGNQKRVHNRAGNYFPFISTGERFLVL